MSHVITKAFNPARRKRTGPELRAAAHAQQARTVSRWDGPHGVPRDTRVSVVDRAALERTTAPLAAAKRPLLTAWASVIARDANDAPRSIGGAS